MGLIENCNRVKQNVENIYTILEENDIVIPEGIFVNNIFKNPHTLNTKTCKVVGNVFIEETTINKY